MMKMNRVNILENRDMMLLVQTYGFRWSVGYHMPDLDHERKIYGRLDLWLFYGSFSTRPKAFPARRLRHLSHFQYTGVGMRADPRQP